MNNLNLPQRNHEDDAPLLDTRELVKKHMENPDHVFTEAELERVVITTEHINVSEHPIVKGLSR